MEQSNEVCDLVKNKPRSIARVVRPGGARQVAQGKIWGVHPFECQKTSFFKYIFYHWGGGGEVSMGRVSGIHDKDNFHASVFTVDGREVSKTQSRSEEILVR